MKNFFGGGVGLSACAWVSAETQRPVVSAIHSGPWIGASAEVSTSGAGAGGAAGWEPPPPQELSVTTRPRTAARQDREEKEWRMAGSMQVFLGVAACMRDLDVVLGADLGQWHGHVPLETKPRPPP